MPGNATYRHNLATKMLVHQAGGAEPRRFEAMSELGFEAALVVVEAHAIWVVLACGAAINESGGNGSGKGLVPSRGGLHSRPTEQPARLMMTP